LGKKNKNFFKANVVPTAIWHYYTIPMRLMAAAATKAKLNGQCCGQRATGECFQINELAPPTPVRTLDHDLRRILTRPETHTQANRKKGKHGTLGLPKKNSWGKSLILHFYALPKSLNCITHTRKCFILT